MATTTVLEPDDVDAASELLAADVSAVSVLPELPHATHPKTMAMHRAIDNSFFFIIIVPP
jgi:hypothetical protein